MRWVDESELLRRAETLPTHRGGSPWTRFRNWVLARPGAPRLVNRETAAEILGVQSPHIARLQRQERMPDPIEVEGGPPVWVREEIEALAEELDVERAAREEKRKEAAGASR